MKQFHINAVSEEKQVKTGINIKRTSMCVTQNNMTRKAGKRKILFTEKGNLLLY